MVANDARKNTKDWVIAKITAGNILDLNGDNASLHHQFTGSQNPLETIFFGDLNKDLLFIYHKPVSNPLIDHDLGVYGYKESVPIQLVAIDKHHINAELLIWQAETEIRRIGETYPFGSYRSFNRISESSVLIGATMLYSVTYELKYVRNTTA